jgi:transposase
VRTIKIKIYPNDKQKRILQNVFDIERVIYNKANELVKSKAYSFTQDKDLRTFLITDNTATNDPEYIKYNQDISEIKKLKLSKEEKELRIERIRKLQRKIKKVKNIHIPTYQHSVHKDIRTNAVNSLCYAYKSAYANLKAKNIRWFNISYKKKSSKRKTFEMSPSSIKIQDGCFRICPGKFGEENCMFKMSKRNSKKYGNFDIQNNCDMLYDRGEYYICLTIPNNQTPEVNITSKMCGIDPGLRTFMTLHDNVGGVKQYHHRKDILDKLHSKLDRYKSIRKKKFIKIRSRMRKVEKKISCYIDNLHWEVINDIVKNHDYVLYGDIKSHDIVKGGYNSTNNKDFNCLKFYTFKKRLEHKCNILKKFFKPVNEYYTSKCCSSCGWLNHDLKDSETYICKDCGLHSGRDINASKNILMKGLLL